MLLQRRLFVEILFSLVNNLWIARVLVHNDGLVNQSELKVQSGLW